VFDELHLHGVSTNLRTEREGLVWALKSRIDDDSGRDQFMMVQHTIYPIRLGLIA